MDEGVSFKEHIKPMFREKDRSRMEWAFDLWDFGAVKENAQGILERLEIGDMPCDEVWAPGQIETFRRWMTGGMAP